MAEHTNARMRKQLFLHEWYCIRHRLQNGYGKKIFTETYKKVSLKKVLAFLVSIC